MHKMKKLFFPSIIFCCVFYSLGCSDNNRTQEQPNIIYVLADDMAPYVYVENNLVTKVPDSTTVNTGKYSWWREGPTSKDFIHEQVTPNFFRRAIALINQQAGKESPFFLYLALPSPHTPILPTDEWQGKSNLNPYGDFVMMIDNYMGQLLRAVELAGIEENTLVIFTCDNGCSPAAKIDELIEKGHYPGYIYRGHKADIFEGGHRVPFIAKWPKKINKGTSCDETICTTDLIATCAEIVGYSLSDNEGRSTAGIPQQNDPTDKEWKHINFIKQNTD